MTPPSRSYRRSLAKANAATRPREAPGSAGLPDFVPNAVFEAALTDYQHRAGAVNVNPLILGSKKTASLEFSLRDCRTGELLWKGDGATSEAKGFLFAGINGYTILCEQLMTMSRYQEPGK